MKTRLMFEGILLLIRVVSVIGWLQREFDKRVATCHPYHWQRQGEDMATTYVWHTHTFLRWKWLASHSPGEARDMIPWEDLTASGEHIHVRVYPAGSRLDE